jgi:hypothetical protein
LDQSPEIDREHLKSALAVWNYCDASVQYLFGSKLGHPIADPILTALKGAAPKGLTKTDISNIFNRNARADSNLNDATLPTASRKADRQGHRSPPGLSVLINSEGTKLTN